MTGHRAGEWVYRDGERASRNPADGEDWRFLETQHGRVFQVAVTLRFAFDGDKVYIWSQPTYERDG